MKADDGGHRRWSCQTTKEVGANKFRLIGLQLQLQTDKAAIVYLLWIVFTR